MVERLRQVCFAAMHEGKGVIVALNLNERDGKYRVSLTEEKENHLRVISIKDYEERDDAIFSYDIKELRLRKKLGNPIKSHSWDYVK